jgi:hypothetical protein
MSFTFVRRVAVAALALPLLLGGCADDEPVPKLPDTNSPASPVTETSTAPVEPTLPPEAEGKGPKAAEAFVRHYLAVVDYSRLMLDPSYLREVSAPTCAGCNGLGDLLAEVAQNGGEISGGDQLLKEVRAEELGLPGDDEAFRATATVQTTEQTINGSGVDGLDGVRKPETLQYGFVLLRSGSRWRVSEWDVL